MIMTFGTILVNVCICLTNTQEVSGHISNKIAIGVIYEKNSSLRYDAKHGSSNNGSIASGPIEKLSKSSLESTIIGKSISYTYLYSSSTTRFNRDGSAVLNVIGGVAGVATFIGSYKIRDDGSILLSVSNGNMSIEHIIYIYIDSMGKYFAIFKHNSAGHPGGERQENMVRIAIR